MPTTAFLWLGLLLCSWTQTPWTAVYGQQIATVPAAAPATAPGAAPSNGPEPLMPPGMFSVTGPPAGMNDVEGNASVKMQPRPGAPSAPGMVTTMVSNSTGGGGTNNTGMFGDKTKGINNVENGSGIATPPSSRSVVDMDAEVEKELDTALADDLAGAEIQPHAQVPSPVDVGTDKELVPKARSPAEAPSPRNPELGGVVTPGPAAAPSGSITEDGDGDYDLDQELESEIDGQANALAPSSEVEFGAGPPAEAPGLPPTISRLEALAAEEEEEVQAAIDTGNASSVAVVLIEAESITGVADGFRISEELPQGTPPMESDPDVVAVKGVALAVLQSADTDPNLIGKLVDAIILSHFPKQAPRFCTRGDPDRPDWWYAHVGGTKTRWVNGTDALCLGNMTFNAVGWGVEPCVSAFSKAVCERSLAKALYSCGPILEEIARYGVNDKPHVCRIIDNTEQLVNRTILREKLEDRELMMRIQEAELSEAQGRRRLMHGGLRSLLVSSGRSADSLFCARCWPPEMCEDAFALCRKDEEKDKKGRKGRKARKGKKGKGKKKNSGKENGKGKKNGRGKKKRGKNNTQDTKG